METKIKECQTLKELSVLGSQSVLNEMEQRLVFERQMEIFQRIMEWHLENEQLGLALDLTDTWTPEQREAFLRDWFDDQVILQTNHGEKRSHEEINEGASASQTGHCQKRSYDEMLDGNEPVQIGRGQDNERPFNIESVTQVNIKKFRTTGMNYRVRFTNAFADLEISSLHDQLHEVFQQKLDETIGDVPPAQDQVRVILHSTQLEYPITFPFMAPHRLTTERILAEFQRVIQSNQEFRLNDTVDVSVIHVSMPSGGKGSKRSEVNLKKHLQKKRSIVRIQNDDDLCMARALVVAKAKLDNDQQYKSIVDHRGTMQTRLAQELHQNAGVPLGPCGIEEAKQFQPTLLITKSVSSRKNTAIKSSMRVQRKTRRFTSICTTTIMTSSPRCLDFSPAFTIAIRATKPTIIRRSIGARVRANDVGFLPSALKCPGKLVKIVISCSRASSVTNNINNLEAMPDPFAKV